MKDLFRIKRRTEALDFESLSPAVDSDDTNRHASLAHWLVVIGMPTMCPAKLKLLWLRRKEFLTAML